MAEAQTQQQGGVAALSDAELITEIKRRVNITGSIQTSDLGFNRLCSDCGDYLELDEGFVVSDLRGHELANARSYWVQRNVRETLWCLEKALGPRFSGLSEITPEQLK